MAGVVCCALASCSSSDKFASKFDPRYGVSSSPRLVGAGEAVPKGGGAYRVGHPYVIGGRTYVPEEDPNYRAEGLASWYGEDFHGRQTANGEIYDMHGISAAHPTLPLPSYARVTNLSNGRSVIVRVNDRGPYHNNRLIDLSVKAARLLDFHAEGIARVRVEYVSRAPLEGSDDSVLLATLRQGEPAPAPSPILLASARPFLPQIGSRIAALRGGVPVPPDRPYTLGDAQGSSEARPSSDVSAAARPRKAETVGFDPRFAADSMPPMIADVPQNPPPVAAFGPPRADAIPSIMTGRGLY
jgi:peptidoglycan lytic transglycosylase